MYAHTLTHEAGNFRFARYERFALHKWQISCKVNDDMEEAHHNGASE
jgi:hypothetical protein